MKRTMISFTEYTFSWLCNGPTRVSLNIVEYTCDFIEPVCSFSVRETSLYQLEVYDEDELIDTGSC